jgi:hypothetical protein
LNFEGKDLSVYVAGWGRLFDQCSTNEQGPVRNLKCAEAEGKQPCQQSRTPSAKQTSCKDFYKANKDEYPKVGVNRKKGLVEEGKNSGLDKA